MEDTQPTPRPRWYWNVPIVLLLGTLVPLGVRGLLTDDARYSWGTFCKQVTYQIDYRWIIRKPDGTLTMKELLHDDELRGEASDHLKGKMSFRNTRYSLGAVKSWIAAYTKYMYERRDDHMVPPDGEVVGVGANVVYRINQSRRLRSRDIERLRIEGIVIPDPTRLILGYPSKIRDALPETEWPKSWTDNDRQHSSSVDPASRQGRR